MTEQEAWIYLAERCENPITQADEVEGSRYEIPLGDQSRLGLCTAIRLMSDMYLIDEGTQKQMRERLLPLRPAHVPTKRYWWPHTKAGLQIRAAICRRLAKECNDE